MWPKCHRALDIDPIQSPSSPRQPGAIVWQQSSFNREGNRRFISGSTAVVRENLSPFTKDFRAVDQLYEYYSFFGVPSKERDRYEQSGINGYLKWSNLDQFGPIQTNRIRSNPLPMSIVNNVLSWFPTMHTGRRPGPLSYHFVVVGAF